GERPRGITDYLQVTVGIRQAQQRKAAIGVTGAQPLKRAFRPRQRGVERVGLDTGRADTFFARIFTRMSKAHAGICLEPRARRNHRQQRNGYSVVPLEVSPFGRPAMVTSMLPP